jgi:molybdenum cofactor cytidylyltransferase
MGAHKLLLPLGDQPIIVHTVRATLAASLAPVLVVVGHQADDVEAALAQTAAQIVRNPDHLSGLSSSIRAGVDALPSQVEGAIMLLADQPLVPATHLTQLARTAERSQAPIVASRLAGGRITPVYFRRALFEELRQVMGDEGGRSVIARHAHETVYVDLADEATALDIDTPADYALLRSLWEQRELDG